MDIGFEGNFKCLKKSINETMHPNWILNIDSNYIIATKTMFNVVFANDIKQQAKDLWCNYFKEKDKEIYHVKSIVDIIKSEREIIPQNIDVVIGGFPCQDFSVCGKRLGFNSTKSHTGKTKDTATEESRGQLYMWFKEVVEITKPKVFVAENVKGLTNLGDVLEIIKEDFKNTADGYIVFAKVLKAYEYGVPQSRERVFFIGFRKTQLLENAYHELMQEKIRPEYNPYPTISHTTHVTCKDAFIDLQEPEITHDIDQKKYSGAKHMGNHCQGQIEIKLDSISPTIRSEHHGNIEYRRLSEEHGGKYDKELKNGLKERRLTIRECARLQTFPDDYSFVLNKKEHGANVSMDAAYKAIGNAVPPILAYNIAKNLEEKWELYFGK
jgi:DNA (cytosine-5)-methyltransferase 1